MKDLHLKYKSDNGTTAYQTIVTDDGEIEIPCEDYLFWIEDLAHKYLQSEDKRMRIEALEEKYKEIERDFSELYSLIGSFEDGSDEFNDIIEAASTLSLDFI